MSTTDQPTDQTEAVPAAPATASPYQPCDSCGAPLDERQRYCLTCGARVRRADDPAARFLSRATQRRGRTATTTAVAARHPRTAPLAAVGLIALVPIALGAGVLVGRSSAGGDAKLIAALRAQKAPVIEYSGAGAPSGAAGALASAEASTTTAKPVSTFALSQGYALELGTLPASATQAAANAAERADRAKGAPAVGLVSQSDFQVTPNPPLGDYVVISGTFTQQSAAEAALGRLKKAFPKAIVIKLAPAGSAPVAGKVLAKTQYGSAHQVDGYKPSAAALSQGRQVAAQDSHNTGQAASGAGLPDIVVVP